MPEIPYRREHARSGHLTVTRPCRPSPCDRFAGRDVWGDMSRGLLTVFAVSAFATAGTASAVPATPSHGTVVKIGDSRSFTRAELRPGTAIKCSFRSHTLSVNAPSGREVGEGTVWPGGYRQRFHLSASVKPGGGFFVTCGRGGSHSEPAVLPADRKPPRYVVIPVRAETIGLDGGFDLLRALGLRVAITGPISTSALNEAIVKRLRPRPGTRVLRDSVIWITPDVGAFGSPGVLQSNPHYRVPNFVGKPASAAVSWAESRDMYWAIPKLPALPPSTAQHLFDAYRVVSQLPRPGGTIRQGVMVGRGFRPTPLTLTVTPR